MIRLQINICVPGLNNREVTNSMLNCNDLVRDFLVKLTDHSQARIERGLADVQFMDSGRAMDEPDDDEHDEPLRKRGRSR